MPEPAPQRSDFRLLARLRVRWAEIDAQQIVFNAHYLMYVDTAVAAWWRALAMPYAATMAALGGDLYVRKATVEYLDSARYDDVLDVGIRCGRIGTSSITLAAAVFRQNDLLVSAELVYVFADVTTQTSRPVPASLRAVMQAFEAGEAMVAVSVGGWAEQGDQARALRSEVFVHELGVPAELESDAADALAVHAVALNRFGQCIATGRLVAHDGGLVQLGRLAVSRPMRHGGIGAQVLNALLQAARERGEREVMLNAQVDAVPFYRRAGFVLSGPVFHEAGIAHQQMRLPL